MVVTTFRSGNGARWLDLLQTLEGRYRSVQRDQVATPAAVRAWLRANGLEPTGGVTGADVEAVGTVREALHRLAVAAVRRTAPARADVRTLDEALRADPGLRLSAGPDGVRVRRPASVAEALGRMAREAAGDLAEGGRGQLRACGDDTCSGIFLDLTGRRLWCSDQRCGNRMRVRAHRARAEQG